MQAGDVTPDLAGFAGMTVWDWGGESTAEGGGYEAVVGEGFAVEGDGLVGGT